MCLRKKGSIHAYAFTIVFSIEETFKLQHVPSGRCFSYSSGQNDDKIILKAACSDDFSYDGNGGLKHVATSNCAYLDNNGHLRMSQPTCNAIDAAIITKDVDGKLLLKMPRNGNGNCIVQTSFGAEGDGVKNGSCSTRDINFRYLGSKFCFVFVLIDLICQKVYCGRFFEMIYFILIIFQHCLRVQDCK